MRYIATIGNRQIAVETSEQGHLLQATVDGIVVPVQWQPVGGAALRQLEGASAGHYSLLAGSRSLDVYVQPVAGPAADPARGSQQLFEVSIARRTFAVQLEDEHMRALASIAGAAHERGEAPLSAPMPGLVTQVVVSLGQTVLRGETLIVLEAMKMENDLGAPRSGIVRELRVSSGNTVDQGQVLAIVGDANGEDPPAIEDDL